MKKAWLVSLILHGLAVGALYLVPQPSPSPSLARMVDVDLWERASRKGSVARRNEAARAVANPVAPAAAVPSETATSGAADHDSSEGYAAIIEYRPAPPYPAEAQDAGLEGEILVEIRTDEAGFVKNIVLVKSSGHEVLDQSVINTVKTWRLKPLKTLRVPVNFHLES